MGESLLKKVENPFLQAFASHVAVVQENTRLVGKLQSANRELETAYEKTLEGWVMALELRDNATEGHENVVVRFMVGRILAGQNQQPSPNLTVR